MPKRPRKSKKEGGTQRPQGGGSRKLHLSKKNYSISGRGGGSSGKKKRRRLRHFSQEGGKKEGLRKMPEKK